MSELEDIRGIRIIPVASNRVRITDGEGKILLDIFDQLAGRGFEIDVYDAREGSQPPKQTIMIDGAYNVSVNNHGR